MYVISKKTEVEGNVIQLFWSSKLAWWTQLSFEAKQYDSRGTANSKLKQIGDDEAKVIDLIQPQAEVESVSYGEFNYYECIGL